jgi:PII-like signaling protein
VLRALREAGAAGATSLRGIWGYHRGRAPHGDKLLQGRRHVPGLTVVIDTPQRAQRWLHLMRDIAGEHALVTSEIVPIR